jgi:hypothetical protein
MAAFTTSNEALSTECGSIGSIQHPMQSNSQMQGIRGTGRQEATDAL